MTTARRSLESPVASRRSYPPGHEEKREREDRRRIREDVADERVRRARRQQPDLAGDHGRMKDVGAREDVAIRIDEAADAGIGGSHEIAAFFDGAHRGLLEMLVRRRRWAEP